MLLGRYFVANIDLIALNSCAAYQCVDGEFHRFKHTHFNNQCGLVADCLGFWTWQSRGHRFKSQPPHCRVQPCASCLHTCASVTKQYNLVPASGQWYSTAGRWPWAWRKSVAAYRRVCLPSLAGSLQRTRIGSYEHRSAFTLFIPGQP